MSLPANARSVTSAASSHPIATASSNTSVAVGGPIVIAVTVPPTASRIDSAASNASLSGALSTAGAFARSSRPVSGSIPTSSLSGTCLTAATMVQPSSASPAAGSRSVAAPLMPDAPPRYRDVRRYQSIESAAALD